MLMSRRCVLSLSIAALATPALIRPGFAGSCTSYASLELSLIHI